MSTTSQSTPFGTALRHLRTRAGLSLYQLGQRTGLQRTRIKRMEDGLVKSPTLPVLNRLAKGLDVHPEVLYDAVWRTTNQPLPTLPTYLREKFHLRDDQITRLSESLDDLTKE